MNYQIELQPSALKYQASSEETLLQSALSNHLPLEHSCKRGDCGLCVATVLSGSALNELGVLVNSGTLLTCCSYPQSDLCLEAQYIPELAGITQKTLPCKIVSFALPQEDILILKLRIPPTASFDYLPGQYIDLIYKGVRRSYSIANKYDLHSGIELHIRLLADGELSNLLRQSAAVDQLMRIEGPKGTFFVRDGVQPIVFLAGGTGIAPVKAMIEHLLDQNIQRPLYVYWGVSHSSYLYTSVISDWADSYDFIHYVPVVSGMDMEWSGRTGLVHQAVLDDFSNLNNYQVYACGSPLMIDSAKDTFCTHGLKKEWFYADIFLPSAEK